LQFWNREYARNIEYAPAPKQIGESIWFHARREFRVGGILQRATDPCVEIETSVPHRNTRTAIFKIVRFIVCHVEGISYSLFQRAKKEKNYLISTRI